MKFSLLLVPALFMSIESAIIYTDQPQVTSSSASTTTENTINGQGNTVDGVNNVINGADNTVKSDSNIIYGDGNKVVDLTNVADILVPPQQVTGTTTTENVLNLAPQITNSGTQVPPALLDPYPSLAPVVEPIPAPSSTPIIEPVPAPETGILESQVTPTIQAPVPSPNIVAPTSQTVNPIVNQTEKKNNKIDKQVPIPKPKRSLNVEDQLENSKNNKSQKGNSATANAFSVAFRNNLTYSQNI